MVRAALNLGFYFSPDSKETSFAFADKDSFIVEEKFVHTNDIQVSYGEAFKDKGKDLLK